MIKGVSDRLSPAAGLTVRDHGDSGGITTTRTNRYLTENIIAESGYKKFCLRVHPNFTCQGQTARQAYSNVSTRENIFVQIVWCLGEVRPSTQKEITSQTE